jgi:hypothetical protein
MPVILIDRQKLPDVPPATQTFCHVREVAKAQSSAFYRGKKGENYIVINQVLCNSQKAENELGYHSVPLRSMLEDCYQWMLSEGLIDS